MNRNTAIKWKAKNLDGVWVEGDFISQYHSSKKCRQIDAIFWSDKFKTYREEVYTNTLTYFLPMPDTNIEGVWVYSDIFEFDFIDPVNGKKSRLLGVMSFDGIELRYQIDVYSSIHPEYVCLWYKADSMRNFKVIGNIHDNPSFISHNFKPKKSCIFRI